MSGWASKMELPYPNRCAPPLAAGMERAVEQTVIRMAGEGPRLCFAGGLGLNALLVSALERSHFESVFVQPAAGNAGTAIGAVLYAWHAVFNQAARVQSRQSLPGAELHGRRNQARARKL